MKLWNPLSFTPMATTFAVVVVYFAVFIPLLIIHETVPPAPSNPTLYRGLNLTEAWGDLQELSNGFHPFNSRRNDEVRDWLLRRIEEILDANGVQYTRVGLPSSFETPDGIDTGAFKSPAATVFSDLTANYTSTAVSIGTTGPSGISTYFEGNNIIVYVRGTEDEEGEWWNLATQNKKTHGKGGVLVNSHFDSVSTGYGATDDGMGVITTLQLVKYFTAKGNTPKKGLVALFNNNEEDGLYGAKAFLSHPMASFVHTFLNLEGAGAGGRATLFRTTDTEVTRAYGKAKHPFGTVVSADGFRRGFVRSGTDYVVFEEEGYRGLDLAFWEPRSKYHTEQDDARHASKDSLWHMLSASVETTKYLASDTSSQFDKPRRDGNPNKVRNGGGSAGIWFDLFGQTFAVFQLRTLFAWSLTLLIAAPLILIIITLILVKKDKYYFFAGSRKPQGHDNESISLGGWKGAFRLPIVLLISGALTVGAAFLLRKVNPLIVFSSSYSVWAMSLALFFCSFWFLMAGCNFVRPSALQRGYVILWLHTIGWLVLVIVAIGEDRYDIGGGYIFVFYYAALFSAALVTLCELFALPTKESFVEASHDEHETRNGFNATHGGDQTHESENDGGENEVTENTPLIGSRNSVNNSTPSLSFSHRYRQPPIADTDGANDDQEGEGSVFGQEQRWSKDLPTWTWLLQFLLLAPFTLIILGQVGLLLVTAMDQTGTDGSPLLTPYIVIALFSILLLLPITPFIHRISHHLPIFLFFVFVGTLIYNLVAFPFSTNNRYKAYFQQTVDLDTNINKVYLTGIEEYIREIISYVPSAAGQTLSCPEVPRNDPRSGLLVCSYEGTAPNVVNNVKHGVPPEKGYTDWLKFNVTREKGLNRATFTILGKETRGCSIRFDDPISAFRVHGSSDNSKGNDIPEHGSNQIKLWHRDWNREWSVDVEWPVSEGKNAGDEGRSGRVACGWADQNLAQTIPALDELQRFAPEWASIVKRSEALVEGSKRFVV
ncbi:putative zinc metalloprotease [Bisporella sp. PMI_857]|nr:putative zinc metalloprotease [Bisporella sp. PMI_857]